MRNVVELREELSRVFMGLKEGTVQSKDASEMAN